MRSVLDAGWAPATVFLTHAVLARTEVYYGYPWLDIPMHLLGGVAIAFFFDRSLVLAVDTGLGGRPSPILHVAFVFAATCTAAVFWEFAEWSLDLYFEPEETLGLQDTLLDMIRGILGGTFYLVVSRLWPRGRAGRAV